MYTWKTLNPTFEPLLPLVIRIALVRSNYSYPEKHHWLILLNLKLQSTQKKYNLRLFFLWNKFFLQLSRKLFDIVVQVAKKKFVWGKKFLIPKSNFDVNVYKYILQNFRTNRKKNFKSWKLWYAVNHLSCFQIFYLLLILCRKFPLRPSILPYHKTFRGKRK